MRRSRIHASFWRMSMVARAAGPPPAGETAGGPPALPSCDDRARMHLSRAEFDRVVEEAVSGLPPEFAELLENVAIVVEEEPSEDDLDALEDENDELLGIYRGISRIE